MKSRSTTPGDILLVTTDRGTDFDFDFNTKQKTYKYKIQCSLG